MSGARRPQLWYDTPAAEWTDALPLGNGRLGAMVYGRPGRELVQLNDATAWSGSPASEITPSTVAADDAVRLLGSAREALARGDHAAAIRDLQATQNRYVQAFLPFADLHLGCVPSGRTEPGEVRDHHRQLHLDTAEHVTESVIDGVAVRTTMFASHPDGVLVVSIRSEAPVDLDLGLTSPLRVLATGAGPRVLETGAGSVAGPAAAWVLLQLPSDVPPPYETAEEIAYSDAPGASLRGAAVAVWQHDGTEVAEVRAGAATAGDDAKARAKRGVGAEGALRAQGITRALIVVATETTLAGIGAAPAGDEHDARDRALARASRALAAGEPTLRERHRADHAALFGRVRFEVDQPAHGEAALLLPTDRRILAAQEWPAGPFAADPDLAALLFHYGRYLLIASSRRGGIPATLQGLWNASIRPPWSSNYTLNINTEMNYWAAETANLAECLDPLVALVEEMARLGRATARRWYGLDGWVAHHNTDVWAYTSPIGLGHSDPAWASWPLASGWLALVLWDHVRFGAPAGFDHETAWPVLREAARFYLGWLVELPDGTLGTSPSTSPENHFVTPDGVVSGVGVSSAMDLAIIGALFDAVDTLADRIGLSDDPVAVRARAARPRIPAPSIGRAGLVAEWAADDPQVEPAHRHLSHLFFLFPGDGGVGQAGGAGEGGGGVGRGDGASGHDGGAGWGGGASGHGGGAGWGGGASGHGRGVGRGDGGAGWGDRGSGDGGGVGWGGGSSHGGGAGEGEGGVRRGYGAADAALRAAASRSLDARGDDSTGWSLAWKLLLRARLGQSAKTSDLAALVLRPAPPDAADQRGGLYPNLFAAHPPFQIDGNLGFAAWVVESLVQSHTGEIVLLPAVVAEWPAGRIAGVVARPGVVVDIAWRTDAAGSPVLVEATVRPKRGAVQGVAVRYGTGRAHLDLAPGETVTLGVADFR